MPKVYNVTDTKPWTYFDEGGRVVSGYKVYFTVHEFGEGHDVDVPDLNNTEAVNKRIMQVVEARKRIHALGG